MRSQIFVFNSTGTALQDVACAAVAYERALDAACGQSFSFSSGKADVIGSMQASAHHALSCPSAPSLRELTVASFKIGCLGFGGPAGQIALMHRIFVEEKKWIDEARYLHALNFCMLLPGPEAQQLATYVGWLLHGVRGGVIAGALFVLPGALVVFGLSWLYAVHADTPLVIGLFYGIKAAVLGFVAEALWKIGRRALKTRTIWLSRSRPFSHSCLFGPPFPVLIVAAGLLGILRARDARPRKSRGPRVHVAALGARGAIGGVFLGGGVACAAGARFGFSSGRSRCSPRSGSLFSQFAMVTFGGAYAVLAYLQQQAVDVHGWLEHGPDD